MWHAFHQHNHSVQECLDPTLPVRILFAIHAGDEYGATTTLPTVQTPFPRHQLTE